MRNRRKNSAVYGGDTAPSSVDSQKYRPFVIATKAVYPPDVMKQYRRFRSVVRRYPVESTAVDTVRNKQGTPESSKDRDNGRVTLPVSRRGTNPRFPTQQGPSLWEARPFTAGKTSRMYPSRFGECVATTLELVSDLRAEQAECLEVVRKALISVTARHFASRTS